MNNIDMHFHSTMSDWKLTNPEIIQKAKEEWVDLAIVTEHDIVNKDFPLLASENNIQSAQWVEISTTDEIISNKHLHILCYANDISWKIVDLIENTRKWKVAKIKIQLDKLKENWFFCSYEEFIEDCINKAYNIENLNSFHINNYIFENSKNKEVIKKITWEDIPSWEFIGRCLKEEWDFRDLWWWPVVKYEPSISEVWKIIKNNWYFLSLAHPNFNFGDDYELFRKFIEEYKDIFNAIEINSLATKKWVEVILDTAKKYNMILTFGSDDHFYEMTDDYHGRLWTPNPHISESIRSENINKFKNKLK